MSSGAPSIARSALFVFLRALRMPIFPSSASALARFTSS